MGNDTWRKQLQVVAVCDVDGVKCEKRPQKVEKAYADARQAGQFKGCTEFHEFEKLVERPDIDSVLCAVPDHCTPSWPLRP
jgi:predicted dehydrogenase